jgi:hypothetical protein
MSTLTTLVPALPVDLVHLVLDYAPGVALDALSAQERIEVVRRLTGLSVSDERASLMLEQRHVGNHDFDDLTLVSDEDIWYEAVHMAYSFRAWNELVRLGMITPPPSFLRSDRDFVKRSLCDGDEQGLALARHLESRGPNADILCRMEYFTVLMKCITYAPTVQYLLHRLLDAADMSFDIRKKYYLSDAPRYTHVFLGAAPSPIHLLVYQFYRDTFVISGDWLENAWEQDQWASLPWVEELRALCPETNSLLLHLDLLRMMSDISYVHTTEHPRAIRDVLADVRPPGKLTCTWNARLLSLTYGPYTMPWNIGIGRMPRVSSWIVDDWLDQARETNQWENFYRVFEVVQLHNDAINSLIKGLPDHEVVHQFTTYPIFLKRFFSYGWVVPRVLIELLPFETWMRTFAAISDKSFLSHPIYLHLFDARQRAQLRRA